MSDNKHKSLSYNKMVSCMWSSKNRGHKCYVIVLRKKREMFFFSIFSGNLGNKNVFIRIWCAFISNLYNMIKFKIVGLFLAILYIK